MGLNKEKIKEITKTVKSHELDHEALADRIARTDNLYKDKKEKKHQIIAALFYGLGLKSPNKDYSIEDAYEEFFNEAIGEASDNLAKRRLRRSFYKYLAAFRRLNAAQKQHVASIHQAVSVETNEAGERIKKYVYKLIVAYHSDTDDKEDGLAKQLNLFNLVMQSDWKPDEKAILIANLYRLVTHPAYSEEERNRLVDKLTLLVNRRKAQEEKSDLDHLLSDILAQFVVTHQQSWSFSRLMHWMRPRVFKKTKVFREPHEALDEILEIVGERKHKDSLNRKRKGESFWFNTGVFIAVAAAVSWAITMAGGFLIEASASIWIMLGFAALIFVAGAIAYSYLHRLYSPITYVKMLTKNFFKGLTFWEGLGLFIGIIFAAFASVALGAISFALVSYTFLAVSLDFGIITLTHSLTLSSAVAPWLVVQLTPGIGLLLGFFTIVSALFALSSMLNIFPVLIKDYRDFITQRRWNEIIHFFHGLFNSELPLKTRLGKWVLLFMTLMTTAALLYLFQYPTSTASSLSAYAILSDFHIWIPLVVVLATMILWGGFIADVPFVIQNTIEFILQIWSFMVGTFNRGAEIINAYRKEEALVGSPIAQTVQEVFNIEEEASSTELVTGVLQVGAVGGFMMLTLLLTAYGDGQVSDEGARAIQGQLPFNFSERTAEGVAITASAILSFFSTYNGTFVPVDYDRSKHDAHQALPFRMAFTKMIQVVEGKDKPMSSNSIQMEVLQEENVRKNTTIQNG